MKVYRGRREGADCKVTVDFSPLDPRADLFTMSSSGFEWGYEGGGPRQLALAILADHFSNDATALAQFKQFCSGLVSMLREDEWTLDSDTIDNFFRGYTEVPMTLDELLDKVRGRT